MLGGAVVALPLAAQAQRPEPTRRVGVLMNAPESDPSYRSYAAAFAQTLQRTGMVRGEKPSPRLALVQRARKLTLISTKASAKTARRRREPWARCSGAH